MENDITDIGKVAITPQKDYKENATYEWLDVVTYDGASYMCINEDGCTGIVPTNTEYWQLLADKGRFTEEDKEAFKQAVVEESKTTINEHTETKKTELDNYTTNLKTSLKNELDTYEEGKEEELDIHKTTLETEMTNTKDSLVEEIETAKNGFDENVTAKITEFNNNATEQTNTFNSNAETKTADFNTNASTKQTEYDDNATSKLEEYNSNATSKLEEYNNNSTTKLAEFNENAESYEKRIAELETERDEIAEQMPWNTTDIAESIHIEDSAKYSRNKLIPFGNLKQETRKGYNILSSYESQTNTTIYYNVLYKTPSMKENKQYTISFKGKPGDKFRIAAGTYGVATETSNITVDSNGVGIGHFKTRESFTSDSTGILSNFADNNTLPLTNICIAEGYYEELPFEPYGAMPSIEYPSMPVVATGVQKIKNLKRNCLDCTKFKTNNYIEVLESTENSIVVKGINKFYTGVYEVFKLKPNTIYTIQSQVDNVGIKSMGRIIIYSSYNNQGIVSSTYKIGETNSILEGNTGNIKTTFTTNDTGIVYILFICNNASNTGTVTYSNVQLEEGAIATEVKSPDLYELDLADTELCKITDSDGNVVAQDRAVYREVDGVNKWQWEKNVTKIIFDGSENWNKSSNTSNTIFYVYNIGRFLIDTRTKVSCNFFTGKIVWNKDKIGIELFDTSNLRVGLGLSAEITTADEWKSWLNEHNMVLYYIKDTSTYEDCTEEQSAVLDKLYKLSLEKGTNNIFVESENGVTTELQLTYMQDLQSKLNQLESMILSNASEEV